ncbi:hypothetical protein OCU04_003715 [Sclerotinia nivalis]|uniref:Zn(2)-C6 fungal-type domain-containing protein n=1 Tax=Sclerotinia nivalis TaxID=352851 RepID=A0A9X0ASK9_9HELO|nr:hypothetical protein OCU04_003715 [Sclerotinia nivalis]
MGRTKSKPIDTSKLKSINGASTTSSGNFGRLDVAEDRVIRCTTQPPFLTFNNSGVIGSIHEVHRRVEHSECIDFRSTWVSQCLLQEEEEWIAGQCAHGVPGNRQLRMKRTAGKNKAPAQQDELIRKYMEPSDEINPHPKHVTNAIDNRPKQVEFPPVVDTINRLAGQMEGKRINGRMSLLEYWREDSHDDTVPRGRSGSLSTIIDVDVDDLEAGEPFSSGGSEHYIAPSHRPHAPAPTPRATLAVTTASVRACVNCYERHVGCDRGLPRCSACATSNANCVYPDVSPPG